MATASCPTLSFAESPSAANGKRVAFGLHHGQVGPRVVADHAAGHLGAVVQAHADLLAALHDVVIREQEAVGREQHAGARCRRAYPARREGSRPPAAASPRPRRRRSRRRRAPRRRSGCVRDVVGGPESSPPLVMKCCQNRDMGSPFAIELAILSLPGKRLASRFIERRVAVRRDHYLA